LRPAAPAAAAAAAARASNSGAAAEFPRVPGPAASSTGVYGRSLNFVDH
jgi:hypothetical protein